MEAIYGISIAGFVTGSSVLHPKSAEGLHVFGPNEEVKNMVSQLIADDNVQAFVKTSVLCVEQSNLALCSN
jgi:hypothetical protein